MKDPTPPEERLGVIYKIKCICGDFYVRETGRNLTTRVKEHKAACRLAAFDRSAVAERAWQEGHDISFLAGIIGEITSYINLERVHVMEKKRPDIRLRHVYMYY